MTVNHQLLESLTNSARTIAEQLAIMLRTCDPEFRCGLARFRSIPESVAPIELWLACQRNVVKASAYFDGRPAAEKLVQIANADHIRKWGRGTHYSHSAHSWLIWEGVTISRLEVAGPDEHDYSDWDGTFGGDYFDCIGEDGSTVSVMHPHSDWIAETLDEARSELEREYSRASRMLSENGGRIDIHVADDATRSTKASRNPERDAYVVKRKGEDATLREIMIEVNANPDWRPLNSRQAVQQVLNRIGESV